MKELYSIMLIFHYFVTILTTCSDLFILLGNSDLTNVFITIFSLLTLFGQFACYTFPAEAITAEFFDLADTLYATKWYYNSLQVQKIILFIIMKSQSVQYLSGAGIIDINVQAFGSVVRKSFSFYAIMKNILYK